MEHQLQLEESKTRVEKGIASLERICEDLVEKEKALKQKHAQVDEWLQKYDSKVRPSNLFAAPYTSCQSQVDVDSIVVPKDSLTAQ